MPIIQHLGTAYASGGGSVPPPVTDNLQIWLDPTLFTGNSSGIIAQNSDHTFNSNSISSGSFRIMNAPAKFKSSVANNHGIEAQNSGDTMCALTYNQDFSNLDNIQNYSFQLWVYVGNQSNGGWQFIGGKSGFWGSKTGGIFINSDGVNWGFHAGGDGQTYVDIPNNGWHNVAGVRNVNDSSSRRLYVDGSLAASDNYNTGSDGDLDNNNAVSILCHGSSLTTPGYPVGQGWGFGHCLYYSDALTAAEVLSNYNVHKAFYGL
jgi:hypothetical protein